MGKKDKKSKFFYTVGIIFATFLCIVNIFTIQYLSEKNASIKDNSKPTKQDKIISSKVRENFLLAATYDSLNSRLTTLERSKIADYHVITSCNNALTPGVVYAYEGGGSSSGCPSDNGWWYIWNYNSDTSNSTIIQFAALINYNKTDRLYFRIRYMGNWKSWVAI